MLDVGLNPLATLNNALFGLFFFAEGEFLLVDEVLFKRLFNLFQFVNRTLFKILQALLVFEIDDGMLLQVSGLIFMDFYAWIWTCEQSGIFALA